MKTVKVKKAKLLDTLRQNRDKHVEDFKDACTGYREAVEKNVKELLKTVKKADSDTVLDLELYINLSKPVSHKKDYDIAISMLEWSVDEFVNLDQREFRQYVNDEWDWKETFAASTSFYKSIG